MSTRRALGILGVLTSLLVVSSASIPASTASAAGPCEGQIQYYVGTEPTTLTHYGVKADINSSNPALCGTGWSMSSAWTMMTGGGDYQYAQSGYLKWGGYSGPVIFAQYKKNLSTPQVHKELSVATGTITYSQVYNFTTGKIDMKYGSTTILTTNFDPTLEWGAGWYPQWEGETHDQGDDMPGTIAVPVYFGSMAIITSRTSGWVTPPSLPVSSTSTRYDVARDTSTIFHIWTK